VVACPLVPGVSRLLSGSWASPRVFVPRCLQPSPRDAARALPCSCGLPRLESGLAPPSTKTGPAHTLTLSGAPLLARPLQRLVSRPTTTVARGSTLPSPVDLMKMRVSPGS